MTERWEKVSGWPYQVSDLGRVMRLTPGRHTQAGQVLTPSRLRTGQQVRLTQMVRLNGEKVQISKTWLVHRLVYAVFVGNPGGSPVRPLNGDMSDPRLCNLALRRDGRVGRKEPVQG